MRVQLAWTFLAEALVMISGLLILKLAASLLGDAGFGEYTLSRRAIGLLYLPLVMGLGLAAPRYIAIARTGTMPEYREGFFATATLTTGALPAIVVALLLNIAPSSAAALLFGDASLAPLIPAASIALVGIALHSLAYSIYRGRSEMRYANALQIVNLAIVPVAMFGLARNSAVAVLQATAWAWIGFSLLAVMDIVRRVRHSGDVGSGFQQHVRLLLKFGLPRVPGEFALVGLFAIPALIASHVHGVVLAGKFSAALSLLTIVAGFFAPLGLIVLPRVSAQVALGDREGVRELIMKVLAIGILLAVVGVAIGELVLEPLVAWYFGSSFLDAVPVFRAVLVGAVPYVVYVLMRNFLDALDVKAVNSRNLIVTLFILVLLCLIRTEILWMAKSLVAALALLGALTLRDTYLRLRVFESTAPAVTTA